jgi:hypothetical protein
MEFGYSLVKHIKIYNSDPICAIDLNNELLLFGTMLGYCGFYCIKEKSFHTISEIQDEQIIGVQIKENVLYLVVGDQKTIVIKKNQNSYKNYIREDLDNYYKDAYHYKNCENMFCMLSGDLVFSIELKIPKEGKNEIEFSYCNYGVKNLEKLKQFKDKIEISNFWVPYDYNGMLIIYIDFLEGDQRCLNIFDLKEKNFIIKNKICKLDSNLGHISHIKFLKNEKIFLVHKYKFCQIRNFKFKIINEFEHIGSEIIACDIFYTKNNKLKIALLDINADVYTYDENNNSEFYCFNLYKLNCISDEIKNEKFFAIGYPYFIKMYDKYFAITTDQGCFLFKKV